MKYLKTFELLAPKYKEGDFVRVSSKGKITDETREFVDSNTGKISDIDKSIDNAYPYTIDFPDNLPNKKFSTFVFTEAEIIRLATPEEIQEYNIKKEANKYNL